MVTPLCPYFGQCGGCSSQHIAYDVQLLNKAKTLSSLISVDQSSISIFRDKEYAYRNRMDFIFHPRGLGLRKKGDWRSCVDVEKCVIADDKINVLLSEINSFFKGVDAYDVNSHRGTFRYAVIRTPSNDSSVSFVLNSDSQKLADAIEKIKSFATKTTANNVIITYVESKTDNSISSDFFVVKGKDFLTEGYLDKTFQYSVQGFFQNNSFVAEKMHEFVRSILQKYDKKDSVLLDLYAGVGTFGINNSDIFDKVLIVENDENCVNAARLNIQDNRIKNAEIVELDATNLKKLDINRVNSGKNLFVITDPPRSGMSQKTIDELKKLAPKVIIYISCNVEQLARDLKKLPMYQLKSTAMFDLFPHTPHIEAVVELVLK